jgi:hypothetical protein
VKLTAFTNVKFPSKDQGCWSGVGWVSSAEIIVSGTHTKRRIGKPTNIMNTVDTTNESLLALAPSGKQQEHTLALTPTKQESTSGSTAHVAAVKNTKDVSSFTHARVDTSIMNSPLKNSLMRVSPRSSDDYYLTEYAGCDPISKTACTMIQYKTSGQYSVPMPTSDARMLISGH